MKFNYLITTILVYLYSFNSFGLTAGEVMFVAFNADNTDGFSILTLVDIPANSTIHFNDNEWNGSVIGSGGAFYSVTEGEITWESGVSILSAGTVITFEDTKNTATTTVTYGTVTGDIDLNSVNEVLYAFEGADNETPTTFLSAIANDGFSDVSEGASGYGTLGNTGLTADVNAIELSGDDDVIVYTGSTVCNSTVADCAADIADISNWEGEGGAGDQSNDSIGPDFPTSIANSFSGSALPVKLSSFEGGFVDGVIVINWETASEINNDFFELRRSVDGIEFQFIATILGNGTSTKTHKYQVKDELSLNSEEGYYYELRQVDFDGKSEVFPKIYVKTNSVKPILNIYPNPINNGVVNVNSSEEVISAFIMDGAGKRIKEFFTQASSSSVELDVKDVLSGNYLLVIITKNNSVTRRIVVN